MSTDEFAQCERNGVDQGVHNVLIHTDRINSPLFKYDQMSGPVANMQAKIMKLTSDFRVVNNKVRGTENRKAATSLCSLL